MASSAAAGVEGDDLVEDRHVGVHRRGDLAAEAGAVDEAPEVEAVEGDLDLGVGGEVEGQGAAAGLGGERVERGGRAAAGDDVGVGGGEPADGGAADAAAGAGDEDGASVEVGHRMRSPVEEFEEEDGVLGEGDADRRVHVPGGGLVGLDGQQGLADAAGDEGVVADQLERVDAGVDAAGARRRDRAVLGAEAGGDVRGGSRRPRSGSGPRGRRRRRRRARLRGSSSAASR